MLTLALAKGRLLDESLPLLSRAGLLPPGILEGGRDLTVVGRGIRVAIVRAQDVATFVRHGGADLGVVGRDALAEGNEADLFLLADLPIGRCTLVVAAREGFDYPKAVARRHHLRVATKYLNLCRAHFSRLGVPVHLIKLWGSMELAPLLGMSEAIVDLMSTGATLKAHGLVAVDEVMRINACLIANPMAFKAKRHEVLGVATAIEEAGRLANPLVKE